LRQAADSNRQNDGKKQRMSLYSRHERLL